MSLWGVCGILSFEFSKFDRIAHFKCEVGITGGYFALEVEEASAFAKGESVLQQNCPVDCLAVSQGKN